MKSFEGIVAMQAQALMDMLRQQTEERCRTIRQEAGKRSRDLTRAARRQARLRMRQAITQERQRMEAALSRARGRARTRERAALQQHYKTLLGEGWGSLDAALRDLWRDDEGRRRWCRSALADAARLLDCEAVQVRHGAGLPDQDRLSLSDWASGTLGLAVTWEADDAVDAGVRISSGPACLDASLEGVLHDRPDVEASLLAAWDHAASAHARRSSGDEAPDDG